MKTTITESGLVSIPSELRREMQLAPGKTIFWEKVSATECRFMVEAAEADPVAKPDHVAAIGFARRHGLPERTTAEWMKILREGDAD